MLRPLSRECSLEGVPQPICIQCVACIVARVQFGGGTPANLHFCLCTSCRAFFPFCLRGRVFSFFLFIFGWKRRFKEGSPSLGCLHIFFTFIVELCLPRTKCNNTHLIKFPKFKPNYDLSSPIFLGGFKNVPLFFWNLCSISRDGKYFPQKLLGATSKESFHCQRNPNKINLEFTNTGTLHFTTCFENIYNFPNSIEYWKINR